eukprot:2839137-Pleurochrysis_carterae.AAC.1
MAENRSAKDRNGTVCEVDIKVSVDRRALRAAEIESFSRNLRVARVLHTSDQAPPRCFGARRAARLREDSKESSAH